MSQLAPAPLFVGTINQFTYFWSVDVVLELVEGDSFKWGKKWIESIESKYHGKVKCYVIRRES